MRRLKALVDPRASAEPRGHRPHRPEGAPGKPEVAALHRAGGGHVHRVRLLRAGLPEPRAHAHPAPAHRRPTGAGAAEPGGAVAEEIRRDYRYAGLETCAGDGMCQTRCPVSIDTGALMKRFRADASLRTSAGTPGGPPPTAARATERMARAGPRRRARPGLGRRTSGRVGAMTGALRALLGDDVVPRWTPDMPRAAPSAAPHHGRRRAGHLLPGLRAAHLRPGRGRARAADRPRGAGGGRPPRRRPGAHPGGHHRCLLQHALALQGLRRGRRGDEQRHRGAPLAVDRRGSASGGGRGKLLHPRFPRGPRLR